MPIKPFVLWTAGGAIVGVTLLWLLAPILSPFLAALILAYVCDPLVDRLERVRIPRTAATLIVMAGFLTLAVSLVLILVPLVEYEVRLLWQRVPAYLGSMETFLTERLGAYGVALPDAAGLKAFVLEHWQAAGSATSSFLPTLKSGLLAVMGALATVALVPLVMFYLLRDWDAIFARADALVPTRWRPAVRRVAGEADAVLSEFLRGQLLVMAAMAVFYSAGLALCGLDFAVPIGVTAGLLVFIPYLGVTFGFLAATLTGWMQFQTVPGLFPVWIVLALGQIVEGFWLTPRLVGERIGLHPLAVLFSLMAFGQLFGFFGVLLALPASAAILVALRHLRVHYERLEAGLD
jgi:predicted PurR-regulated permease PerM